MFVVSVTRKLFISPRTHKSSLVGMMDLFGLRRMTLQPNDRFILEGNSMTFIRATVALLATAVAAGALAAGNTTNEDFRDAKKMLERKVYMDHRVTLYCGYAFDKKKNVNLPSTFTTPGHNERATRVEWEHVVPAENFGRAFKEWRDGSGRCINDKGHFFKGRRCAEKLSPEFRLMQADMFNLFPAVGAVNAVRSNYNYEMLPNAHYSFGSCEMKIDGRRAEPPARSRGEIARAMLYMENAYSPIYKMSNKQRRLIEEWNREYPVTQWECTRASRIAQLQGNENPFVAEACRKAGLDYRGL